ncbi:MAG: hypothetical protein LBM60_08005 [Clostridium sp.]|jgi:hypothetical protein|nr:hypothetical protein [Clostridium sp.]
MNPKKRLSLISIVCLFVFVACQNRIPSMSAQEEQDIKLYAMELLLRYDRFHEDRLVDLPDATRPDETSPKPPEEPDQPSHTPTSDDTTPTPDNPIPTPDELPGAQGMSLNTFFSLPDGVTLTYLGAKLCDVYPDDNSGAYTIYHKQQGNRMLVMSFRIENLSPQEQSIDIAALQPSFRVDFAGHDRANTKYSLLPNDMSLFMAQLGPGAFTDLFLLAEVSANVDLSTLTLTGAINGQISPIIL